MGLILFINAMLLEASISSGSYRVKNIQYINFPFQGSYFIYLYAIKVFFNLCVQVH